VTAIANYPARYVVCDRSHHLFHHFAQTCIAPNRENGSLDAFRRMCAVLGDILEERAIIGHSCAPSSGGIATDIFVEGCIIDRRWICRLGGATRVRSRMVSLELDEILKNKRSPGTSSRLDERPAVREPPQPDWREAELFDQGRHSGCRAFVVA
jgi:hypothetical protein